MSCKAIKILFNLFPYVGLFSVHLLWSIFLYTLYLGKQLTIGFYHEHYIWHSVCMKSWIFPKLWSIKNLQNGLKSTYFKVCFKFWDLRILRTSIKLGDKKRHVTKQVCLGLMREEKVCKSLWKPLLQEISWGMNFIFEDLFYLIQPHN